jgi:hypothetical protein
MRTVTVEEYDQIVIRQMSETDWQKEMEEKLAWAGFGLIYHTHNSKHSRKGFPDLAAIRQRGQEMTLLFVELKKWDTKPTPDQEKWLGALEAAAQLVNAAHCRVRVIVDCWRPQDRVRIQELLA